MAECHSTRALALPPIDFSIEDGTEIAPGVTVDHHQTLRIFRGKEAPLIAAGILTPDLLPGAPGQPKGRGHGTVEGRLTHVYRARGRRLNVYIHYTEAECAAFDAWQDAGRRLAELPGSAEEYRRDALGAVRVASSALKAMLVTRGGFSFDAEIVEQVEDFLAELKELIEREPISHSQAGRWAEEAKIRAEVLGDA